MLSIYLGKSNKANPDTVSLIRASLSKEYKVLEFEGGLYSDLDIRKSNYYVCVLAPGTHYIGKGLYEQLRLCKDLNIPIIIIYTRKSGRLAVVSDANLEIVDSTNYIVFGRLISFNLSDINSVDQIKHYLNSYAKPIIIEESLKVYNSGNFKSKLEMKPIEKEQNINLLLLIK